MDAVLTSLVEEQLGPGDKAQEFARQCAFYLDVSGGLALREYRRAVELAIDALEIDNGECVIMSPLAPRVYMDVLASRGIRILYGDVESETACISAKAAEALMDQNPAACIVDSPLGYVPELGKLSELGVPIIEDITANIGAHFLGRKCGGYGRFAILSLEAPHIITAGGGALVVSQTKKDLGALRKAAESLDSTYLLCDMNAALAMVQLKSIEEFIGRRRDIAAIYTRALMKGKHKSLVQEGDSENVFYSFPVLLESGVRDAMKYARSKKIPTAEAFSEVTAGFIDFEEINCPNAQALYMRCIVFPLYPMLSKDQIEQISRVLSTLP